MQSLTYLRGRRLWVVRDFTVWGLPDDAEIIYLGVENVNSVGRLMFGSSSIGGSAQNVSFSDLVDWRSNSLPESIEAPRVLFRPRSTKNVHLVGEESSTGFRIARDPEAAGPVTVDLFIFETG
jgi:hypothetical protein